MPRRWEAWLGCALWPTPSADEGTVTQRPLQYPAPGCPDDGRPGLAAPFGRRRVLTKGTVTQRPLQRPAPRCPGDGRPGLAAPFGRRRVLTKGRREKRRALSEARRAEFARRPPGRGRLGEPDRREGRRTGRGQARPPIAAPMALAAGQRSPWTRLRLRHHLTTRQRNAHEKRPVDRLNPIHGAPFARDTESISAKYAFG